MEIVHFIIFLGVILFEPASVASGSASRDWVCKDIYLGKMPACRVLLDDPRYSTNPGCTMQNLYGCHSSIRRSESGQREDCHELRCYPFQEPRKTPIVTPAPIPKPANRLLKKDGASSTTTASSTSTTTSTAKAATSTSAPSSTSTPSPTTTESTKKPKWKTVYAKPISLTFWAFRHNGSYMSETAVETWAHEEGYYCRLNEEAQASSQGCIYYPFGQDSQCTPWNVQGCHKSGLRISPPSQEGFCSKWQCKKYSKTLPEPHYVRAFNAKGDLIGETELIQAGKQMGYNCTVDFEEYPSKICAAIVYRLPYICTPWVWWLCPFRYRKKMYWNPPIKCGHWNCKKLIGWKPQSRQMNQLQKKLEVKDKVRMPKLPPQSRKQELEDETITFSTSINLATLSESTLPTHNASSIILKWTNETHVSQQPKITAKKEIASTLSHETSTDIETYKSYSEVKQNIPTKDFVLGEEKSEEVQDEGEIMTEEIICSATKKCTVSLLHQKKCSNFEGGHSCRFPCDTSLCVSFFTENDPVCRVAQCETTKEHFLLERWIPFFDEHFRDWVFLIVAMLGSLSILVCFLCSLVKCCRKFCKKNKRKEAVATFSTAAARGKERVNKTLAGVKENAERRRTRSSQSPIFTPTEVYYSGGKGASSEMDMLLMKQRQNELARAEELGARKAVMMLQQREQKQLQHEQIQMRHMSLPRSGRALADESQGTMMRSFRQPQYQSQEILPRQSGASRRSSVATTVYETTGRETGAIPKTIINPSFEAGFYDFKEEVEEPQGAAGGVLQRQKELQKVREEETQHGATPSETEGLSNPFYESLL